MSSFGLVWKPTNQSTNEPTMECFSLAINDVNVYICTVVHTHTLDIHKLPEIHRMQISCTTLNNIFVHINVKGKTF